MKKSITTIALVSACLFSSCGNYNKILKSQDYSYRYEAAKEYFFSGQYNKATVLLNDMIAIYKGTGKAEESLYMLAMCYYGQEDWLEASSTFKKYYTTYPKGDFTELARFYTCKALYNDTPEPRLDQTSTFEAINEIQMFCEFFSSSIYREEAQQMMFELQDKLVEKEYLSAKLYYNLGNYMGNNYESCVITAQNALQDFPYAKRREDLAYLVFVAKYKMASESILEKQEERYRDVVDEYYAFKNEFPESKRMKDLERMFQNASKKIKE